jgi:hypothetical protein
MTVTDSLMEISSETELRELLGTPMPRAITKERLRLHDRDIDWLAASPFCLIATSAADGACDVSPKGDPPESWRPDALPSHAQIVKSVQPCAESLEELEHYYGPQYVTRIYG